MSNLSNIVIIFTLAVIIYGLFAIFVGIISIVKHRDEFYKKKYENFLDQKKRVENRLKERNEDA